MKFIIFFYYTSPDKRQHRVLRGELYKLTTMMKKGGQARGRGGGQARGRGGGRPQNKQIVTKIPLDKIGLFIDVNLRQVQQNIFVKNTDELKPIIHLDEVDGKTVADVWYTGGDSFFKIIEEELNKEVEKSISERPEYKKTLFYRTKLYVPIAGDEDEDIEVLIEELNEYLGDSGHVDGVEVYPQMEHMSNVWTIWPPRDGSIKHLCRGFNVLDVDLTLHEKISFPDINELVKDFVISINQYNEDIEEPVKEEDEPDEPAEPEAEPEAKGNIWSGKHIEGDGGW